jgi:hypothetical protein
MTRRRALWLLGIVTLVLFAGLLYLDRLMQDAGDAGIVDFELARTAERAADIRAAWGEKGRDAAELSLWLDFPFLSAYAAFLWLAIRALGDDLRRRGGLRLARPAYALAVLPLLAAAFDVVEDVLLLVVLDGRGGETTPALAAAFASAKFVCLGIALAYLFVGLLMRRGLTGVAR